MLTPVLKTKGKKSYIFNLENELSPCFKLALITQGPAMNTTCVMLG